MCREIIVPEAVVVDSENVRSGNVSVQSGKARPCEGLALPDYVLTESGFARLCACMAHIGPDSELECSNSLAL